MHLAYGHEAYGHQESNIVGLNDKFSIAPQVPSCRCCLEMFQKEKKSLGLGFEFLGPHSCFCFFVFVFLTWLRCDLSAKINSPISCFWSWF